LEVVDTQRGTGAMRTDLRTQPTTTSGSGNRRSATPDGAAPAGAHAVATLALDGADGGPRAGRPRLDIARKLLSLLVASALAPAFLVGLVSYITARSILVEKIHGQLDARLAVCEEHLELSLARRFEDAGVFANAFIVADALSAAGEADRPGSPEIAGSSRELLRGYLAEVAGRYEMYRSLAVLDSSGRLVAITGESATEEPGAGETAAWHRRAEADLSGAGGFAFETHFDRPMVVIWHSVSGRDGRQLGWLIALGELDPIWERLSAEAELGGSRLLVVGASAVPLFDSARPDGERPRVIASEGVRRVLAGERAVAQYQDENDLAVVGGLRYSERHRLGLVIELPVGEAFMAVTRMRFRVVLISLLAAVLIAGVGSLLAFQLIRPLSALSEGARLVAGGDLSTEIPVTSRGQIGDLTGIFNRMVRALRESREELENLSVTDDLTGLYNRRYLRRMLDKELSRARRSGEPLSLLMLDIDDFKAFNDLLGHLEGDIFLRKAAELMGARFRTTDIVSRWGGEEFVALLPRTSKPAAAMLAERLRSEFESLSPHVEMAPKVTLSVGLASYPEDGRDQQELLLNADVALYRAKDLGRNRVEMSSLPLDLEDLDLKDEE
jgi:diguanylate cyclase (GGDEF)-like protein